VSSFLTAHQHIIYEAVISSTITAAWHRTTQDTDNHVLLYLYGVWCRRSLRGLHISSALR